MFCRECGLGVSPTFSRVFPPPPPLFPGCHGSGGSHRSRGCHRCGGRGWELCFPGCVVSESLLRFSVCFLLLLLFSLAATAAVAATAAGGSHRCGGWGGTLFSRVCGLGVSPTFFRVFPPPPPLCPGCHGSRGSHRSRGCHRCGNRGGELCFPGCVIAESLLRFSVCFLLLLLCFLAATAACGSHRSRG